MQGFRGEERSTRDHRGSFAFALDESFMLEPLHRAISLSHLSLGRHFRHAAQRLKATLPGLGALLSAPDPAKLRRWVCLAALLGTAGWANAQAVYYFSSSPTTPGGTVAPGGKLSAGINYS